MNVWAKIAIGAAAATGIGYLIKMSRTKAELETVAKAKIHSLDNNGLTIRVDVQIKNPTKGSLSIKYPFVKIIYKDKTIGTSNSINQDIKIPSFGEAQINDIRINIPPLGLLSLGIDLFGSLMKGGEMKALITTVSTIDLGLKTLPYEKTEEVILKR